MSDDENEMLEKARRGKGSLYSWELNAKAASIGEEKKATTQFFCIVEMVR